MVHIWLLVKQNFHGLQKTSRTETLLYNFGERKREKGMKYFEDINIYIIYIAK